MSGTFSPDTKNGQLSTIDYFRLKKIKRLIVIEGPTASGKTALSIALAKHFNSVVVSSDSRQFYQEISIGTAKPSPSELAEVKHYFIDSHLLTDEVTSARYEREAIPLIEELFKTKDQLILTGGSGLFTDAVCRGFDEVPKDDSIRSSVEQEYKLFGLEPLLGELKQKDPEYFDLVDRNNPHRVIRAIEVIRSSGKKYSELRTNQAKKRPFEVTRFVIDIPRTLLYERINQRVDEMMAKGLLEEVRSVLPLKDLKSLQTVGYTELFHYLEGKHTLEEAVNLIKQNSRRYAKRQITWFKRNKDAHWIPYDSITVMMMQVLHILNETAVNQNTSKLE